MNQAIQKKASLEVLREKLRQKQRALYQADTLHRLVRRPQLSSYGADTAHAGRLRGNEPRDRWPC